jgi:hypothetical protein
MVRAGQCFWKMRHLAMFWLEKPVIMIMEQNYEEKITASAI